MEHQAATGAATGADTATGPRVGAPEHIGFPRVPPLLGRDRELGELRAALGRARLVTVTGVGGVGKTVLAVSGALATSVPVGDRSFVDLARVGDAALVPAAVAAAVGLGDDRPGDPVDRLVEGLRDRSGLLVVDNCEHLLGAVRTVVGRVLDGCPGVSLLLTSRQPLRIAGEVLVRLAGLAAEAAAGADGPPPAVALFLERARDARGGVTLAAEEVDAVAELCRRIDGLPLAIELAAARTDVLGPLDLLERLDRQLDLLARREGEVGRHQTLRAVFEWSFELLGEAEQRVFRRLGPFTGGFTLDAAERVCAGDGVEVAEVADVLGDLTEKSMLLARPTGGRSRFSRLETLRRFADDCLSRSGEAAAVRRRHADWCAEVARKAAAAPAAEALARLEPELGNFRNALQWAAGHDPGLALELVTALQWFWEGGGHAAEGRRWSEQVLEASTGAPPAVRAEAEEGLGRLLVRLGAYDEARERFERCRALAGDDAAARARLTAQLGAVARLQGRFAEAEEWLTAALDGYAALGDRPGMASVMTDLGQLAALRSQRQASRLLLGEALDMARRAGDDRSAARALALLGEGASRDGEVVTARRLFDEAADAYAAAGDTGGMATVASAAAKMAQLVDDLDRAEADQQRALALFREVNDLRGVARAYANLGFLAYLTGRHHEAEAQFTEAVGLRRRLGDRRGLAIALVGLANSWFLRHHQPPDPAGAYRLCEQALGIQQEIGDDVNAGWTAYIMAEVARNLGRVDDARAHATTCIELYRRSGHERLAGVGFFSLAAVDRASGQLGDAASHARVALDSAATLGGALQIARCIELTAGICGAAGDHAAAAELRGAATALRERHDLIPAGLTPDGPLLAADLAEVTAALGADGVAHATALGAALTQAEVVARAAALLAAVEAGGAARAPAPPPSGAVAVRLLGGFEVIGAGGQPATTPPGMASQVVKIVAVRRTVHIDELVELLWPDAAPGVGRRRLHNVLSRVRKAYGDVVVRSGETLTLDERVTVDAAEFTAAAASALAAPDGGAGPMAALRDALGRYRGELLPGDRFADWAAGPRERLRQLALRCTTAAARAAVTDDDVTAALGWLEQAIEANPLDEGPYLDAARLLARVGQRSRAERMLARARATAEVLGVAPSAELDALAAALAG
ncbi:MAG TPA: tetratricopeptide repeat protein [Acidimicrobiales bacterium]|nr:tetratricopeptide repeat protein [Acidimicrobiales bacterium]